MKLFDISRITVGDLKRLYSSGYTFHWSEGKLYANRKCRLVRQATRGQTYKLTCPLLYHRKGDKCK